MRSHLRYLRYVLLHKWTVFRGGLLIHPGFRPAWWFRLLVHDLSKFRPSEWQPYVDNFYAEPVQDLGEMQRRRRAFDAAWLMHQHRNHHHWQAWVLREDDGRQKILVPPVELVDEMVADWLGAGTKCLKGLPAASLVVETIAWYMTNRDRIQLRDQTRQRVEEILVTLARHYRLPDLAAHIIASQANTVRFTIPRGTAS